MGGEKQILFETIFAVAMITLVMLMGDATASNTPNAALFPGSASGGVGTTHTVTCTITENGSPVAGAITTFSVVAGPNAGVNGQSVTNAAGQATFTYTDSGGVGTDVIVCSFVGSDGATNTSNTAFMDWLNQPPVAIAQDVTKSANDQCLANVAPNEVDNGSFDPDGDSITLSLSPSGPFSLGSTTVTLTVTDIPAGTTDSVTATVTVVDDTPPTITAPADIVREMTSDGGETVNLGSASASDACSLPVNVSNSNRNRTTIFSPTPFDIIVTWTATDSAGNQATATQRVILQDTTPPNLVVPTDIILHATSPSGAVVIYSVTATDLVEPAVVLVCDPPSGSTFPIGTTRVDCRAFDSAGNSVEATFNVIVTNEDPVAIAQDVTKSANDQCLANVAPNEVDNGSFDPDGDSITLSLSPSGPFSLGSTTVTLTVTDIPVGATDSVTATVTVVDDTPPTITAPADIVLEATNPNGETVNLGSVSASDACSLPVNVSNDAPPLFFQVGDTIVTWTATDASGNSATATQIITVEDTTPPSLSLPTDITTSTTDPAGIIVTYDVTATDLVDGTVTPSCAPQSGSQFPVGTTQVTCTATDVQGNTESASFTVTVQGTTEEPSAQEQKQGIIQQLEVLRDGDIDKKTNKKIKKAIDHIEKSLDPKNWLDGDTADPKKGKKIFDEEKKSVKGLMKILKKGGSGIDSEISIVIALLVDIDRELAQNAIDEAKKLAGDKKVDKEIDKAEKEIGKAQKELDKGKPDKAIDKYKKAWEHAQKALKKKK